MSQFQDCFYHYEGSLFTVGNSRIERSWDLSSGVPISQSLLDKSTDDQWIENSQPMPMFRFPFLTDTRLLISNVEAAVENDYTVAEEHLRVTLKLEYARFSVLLVTRLYPERPYLRHEVSVKLTEASDSDHSAAANGTAAGIDLQLDDNNKAISHLPVDYVDALPFRERHGRWSSAILRDVTDHHNNLVSEDSGLFYVNEKSDLSASILFVSNPFTKSKLFFLKESPTSLGQLQYPGYDYRFIGKRVFMTGAGLTDADLSPDRYMPAYGSVVGVASGTDTIALQALHDYQSSIRRFKPELDSFVMSNTWGDRSKDGRVNEDFLFTELEAAAQMGIGIFQIDDGWQQGATSNSVISGGVWSGYYDYQDNFWQVNQERFPRGLEPIVNLAAQHSIKLGLWFSPDSSNNFSNWQRDAATLLRLHKSYGICYFKLDGINITSKAGEVNLNNMMEQTIRESGSAVCFNLDTTAQIRTGYYGRNQYGCLFLENRYTDWTNYYPHYTLRNLWMLSKYVPTRRLQMEFLNVERNQQLYEKDPLSPGKCGFAYSFGVTMAANPLAWMELTGLSDENRNLLGTMLSAYTPLQAELLGGTVLPIGSEPSGLGWTGFQSLSGSSGTGLLIIYRERCDTPAHSFDLWEVSDSEIQLQCLIRCEGGAWSGDGVTAMETVLLQPDASSRYRFKLNQPFSFAVYRYQSDIETPATHRLWTD
ncbi:alpha-galactosidase [Paenibacillus sp. FSL H7-0331]|uniref:alpha-galactosidase n=1 Tax=Paenibacillus sp. FSL H7-0331 TaxID=1920421 RepID=UPI0015C37153|nr:alpha-galactosidase [Paenibacillus sp. FSL H7-0331]